MDTILIITCLNTIIHIPRIIKAADKYDALMSALISWAVAISFTAAFYYLLGR